LFAVFGKRKSTPTLSLDMSSTTVNLLELSHNDEQRRVESHVVAPLPATAFGNLGNIVRMQNDTLAGNDIGVLFRRYVTSETKNELSILITPRILADTLID